VSVLSSAFLHVSVANVFGSHSGRRLSEITEMKMRLIKDALKATGRG